MPPHDSSKNDVHDFIAIGLGPFNLSLACLAEPIADLRCVFLERHAEFSWHPGMLIDDTTLQNPFLADLVSLADPTSRFSFLNHCKEEGRIYAYHFREDFYLTRAEFNAYCRWAADRLSSVRFGHTVHELVHDREHGCYVVTGTQGACRESFTVRGRKVVLGVGSRPLFPPCCEPAGRHRYLHAADYLSNKAQLQRKRAITVVGSGQSAAEVVHDLLKESDAHDYGLTWITRSPRFFQMETNKLTLEMFSPDYVDHFYSLDARKKEGTVRTQDCLYKGVNARLINRIYDLLDDRRRQGRRRTNLLANCEVQRCRHDAASDSYEVEFRQLERDACYAHHTEGLVFATGYRDNIPSFVDGIRDRLCWDDKGRYQLARNYAADRNGCEVFVQNAAQHTHGMASQDLGMNCYRNSYLLRELTGVEHYKIERRIALQDFTVPDTAEFVRL